MQLSPAVVTWDELRAGVVVAEDAGFDTIWVFDHFMGQMISGGSMLEPFTLLGALAVSTCRIGVGSLVLNVVNRSAAVIASGTASVQAMSRGRFILGLGAGASPTSRWAGEHRVLGVQLGATIAERHARLCSQRSMSWTGCGRRLASPSSRRSPNRSLCHRSFWG